MPNCPPEPSPETPRSLQVQTIAGCRVVVGDPEAAHAQLAKHGEGCQCLDCLAARAALSGKVMTTEDTRY